MKNIKNIKIINRQNLFNELKKISSYSPSCLLDIINHWEKEKQDIDMMDLFDKLQNGVNISFEYEESHNSILNDFFLFTNPLGLANSEKWYNTLSQREKEYIQWLILNNYNELIK